MKKINSIILAACVAALGFFSSCGKDNNPPSVSASVNLLNTNGVINIEVGENATFGYKVEKGSSDIQELKVVLAQSDVELTETLVLINSATTTSPKLSDLNKSGSVCCTTRQIYDKNFLNY